MTIPIQPVADDPNKARIAANVAKMRAQNASDDEVEHYLRDIEGLRPSSAPSHLAVPPAVADDTRVGAPKRTTPTLGLGDVAKEVSAHVLNAAQGMPGMERFEATAGSLGSRLTDHPMSYDESLAALRGETGKIDPSVRILEKVAGSLPVMGAVPANLSGAATGAILGGADQALAADPMSATTRALRTLAGTGAGAAIGYLGDVAQTGLQARKAGLVAKAKGELPSEGLRTELKGAREAAASPLYQQSITAGNDAIANGASTAHPVWDRPEVQQIVNELHGYDQFKNVPAQSPEMLSEVYQTLSGNQGRLVKQLANPTQPAKVALGRAKDQINVIKGELLDAADQMGMAGFRDAVGAYRAGSQALRAANQGNDALVRSLGDRARLSTAAERAQTQGTTPQAFSGAMQSASPEAREAAARGILGATAEEGTVKALRRAAPLLRKTNAPSQLAAQRALQALLLAGNAGVPH